jgi:enoyl-[acyl-carrier-protein] reductase (NADH)
MSVKPCKWRDLKPINITSRPAPGKAIFQSATQRNPALSVIKMAVSDDIKYVQAEAELLDIKVKAVQAGNWRTISMFGQAVSSRSQLAEVFRVDNILLP